MDLIKEAKERGYRKGTAIRYVPHAIDYVEGNYFEVENGELKAYAKPEHERKGFDDFRHDTLFDGFNWVEIVDLSKRTKEQKTVDYMHDVVDSFYYDTVNCVRCNGKGFANPLTYPDQAHYKGCLLCNGTGKNKVKVYPSGRMF